MKTPRQQINTISSFIDASNVYGVTQLPARLAAGRHRRDGNPANNKASLMLPNGYLPRADARWHVGGARRWT